MSRVFESDLEVGMTIEIPGEKILIKRIEGRGDDRQFFGAYTDKHGTFGWQANAHYVRGLLHGIGARIETQRVLVAGAK